MIADNLNIINKKISNAEQKSGRTHGSVKLMAVSKFHTLEAVQQAIENNQLLFGENRVQEAEQKFSVLKQNNPNIQLHMIGTLQSNKVKNIVKIADCIQSVDRIQILQEIEKQCTKINKNIQVLFEIHTAEDSKAGFSDLSQLEIALQDCSLNKYPHIIPKGFMTMAPLTTDTAKIRQSFITLRKLSEKYKKIYTSLQLDELSMGMSNDFEIAIEEGSTLVRVGTAIFGERDYSK